MKLNFISNSIKHGIVVVLITTSIGCEKETLVKSGGAIFKQSTKSNTNKFSDNEHIVTEEEAAAYIQRFKEKYPDMNTQSYWTKRALHELLVQPNIMGTRYYFGQDENGKHELYFIGVDDRQNDMIEGKLIKARAMAALASHLKDKIIDWQDKQLAAIEKAAASTSKHRKAYPGNTIAGTFNKEAMQLLLAGGAVFGVFIEYGLTEDEAWVVVLRPLDKDGVVIPGIIIERSKRCPPSCGVENILNSDK